MMSKFLFCAAIAVSMVAATTPKYSTTAVVTMVGGIMKASQHEDVQKHKRKDCPVCKGKGWYISGDGIAKIQCQYCEP